jgi:hypothetical protein
MQTDRPQLTDEQKAEIKEAFDLFDSEKTGSIDYHELKVGGERRGRGGHCGGSPLLWGLITRTHWAVTCLVYRLHVCQREYTS